MTLRMVNIYTELEFLSFVGWRENSSSERFVTLGDITARLYIFDTCFFCLNVRQRSIIYCKI